MSTINDTDQFLVQRGTSSFKQSAVDLMSTIQDTDLMLIQRGTDSFKVTCLDVKDQLGGGGTPVAPALDSVVLSQNAPIDSSRFTSKSFTTTTVNSGGDATTLEMTGTVTGALNIKAGSDPITVNAYPGTSSTDVVLTLGGTTNLGDVIQVGDTVTANVSYTPETDTIEKVESADIRYLGDWVGATVRTGNVWAGGGDVDEMFNGTTTVYSPGGVNEYATLTFDPPIPCSTLHIRANTSNQSSAGCLKLNGIDFGDATKAFPVGQGVTTAADTYTNIPNPPQTISTLEIGWVGSWIATSGIKVNGTELRQGVPLDVVTGWINLTLSTEKDIKLFQAGDVIQGATDYVLLNEVEGRNAFKIGTGHYRSPVISSEGTLTEGQLINIYNPERTFSYKTWSGTSSGKMEIFFVNPDTKQKEDLAPGAEVVIKSSYLAGGNYGQVWVRYADGSQDAYDYVSDAGQGYMPAMFPPYTGKFGNDSVPNWLVQNNSKSIRSLVFAASGSGLTPNFQAIMVDKKVYCLDSQYELLNDKFLTSTPVSVVGTDVSAKAVTVDGGEWDASNQSEAWSNYCSGTVLGPDHGYSNAFDGNTSTACTPADGQSVTFTPGTPIPCTKLEINRAGGQSSGAFVKVNNVTVDPTPGSDNADQPGWYDISSTVTGGTLISLEWSRAAGGNDIKIRAIRVDGRILVDAVDDSQVWSGNFVETDIVNPQRGFDGDIPNGCSRAEVGSYVKWEAPNALSGDIVVYQTVTSGAATSIVCELLAADNNTVLYTNTNTSVTNNGTIYEHSFSDTTNVKYVKVREIGGASFTNFNGLRVDGKLLVDTGTRDLGDTKVSTFSPKQGSGTVSDITGAQVTVTPFTDNCFKEGQWLTVNKTVTVDPVTDSISGYDAGTKTITLSGDKDLMQFANGDPVSMVNADGSPATYDATTDTISNITSFTPQEYQDQNSSSFSPYAFSDGIFVDNNSYFTIGFNGQTSARMKFNFSEGQEISGNYTVKHNSDNAQLRVIVYEKTNPSGTTFSNDGIGLTPIRSLEISGTDITSIEIYSKEVGGGPYLNIYYLSFPNPGSEPIEILTFNSDTNLQYFKDGDVLIEGVDPSQNKFEDPNNQWTSDRVWQNAFDGRGDTFCSPAIGITCVMTFPDNYWYVDGDLSLAKAGSISNSKMFINGIDVTAAYDNETTLVSNTYITEVRMSRTGAGDGIQLSKFLLDGADLLTPTSPEVTVVGTPTLNPPQMTVSGGSWSNGDTITKSLSGTGTVSSSNPATNTMVLSASNDEWVDGYYVATPTKPVVATTAYLKFNAVGQVTGYQPTPVEPRAMDSKTNPTLTFPATFSDTGQAPDVEFPDANAYIQTSVQLKNDGGNSATVASNNVVPQTSVRSVVAAGQLESNADDVKAMGMQLATHDQRVADHTAAKSQQAIADFEANLRRYTS